MFFEFYYIFLLIFVERFMRIIIVNIYSNEREIGSVFFVFKEENFRFIIS